MEVRWPLIVIAIESGSSGPDLSPGPGHCVVFLDNTLTNRKPYLSLEQLTEEY